MNMRCVYAKYGSDQRPGLLALARARAFQVDVGRERLDVCLCKGEGGGGVET